MVPARDRPWRTRGAGLRGAGSDVAMARRRRHGSPIGAGAGRSRPDPTRPGPATAAIPNPARAPSRCRPADPAGRGGWRPAVGRVASVGFRPAVVGAYPGRPDRRTTVDRLLTLHAPHHHRSRHRATVRDPRNRARRSAKGIHFFGGDAPLSCYLGGRPRGRGFNSIPSRRAMRSIQSESPSGRPLRSEARTASSSDSSCSTRTFPRHRLRRSASVRPSSSHSGKPLSRGSSRPGRGTGSSTSDIRPGRRPSRPKRVGLDVPQDHQ